MDDPLLLVWGLLVVTAGASCAVDCQSTGASVVSGACLSVVSQRACLVLARTPKATLPTCHHHKQ